MSKRPTRVSKRKSKPAVKAKAKVSTTKSRSGKSSLQKLFSLSDSTGSKNNFESTFHYGNLLFDVKSKVKGSDVHLTIKVGSKNFNFSGTATVNGRSLSDLQTALNHVSKNIKNKF